MPEFRRLPASDVGLKAPRSCTNPCGLLMFLAFWALMGYVAVVGYKNGNLNRLQYGVDYLGNICGQGSPNLYLPGVAGQPAVNDWASRKYLWYPVTYSNGQFLLTESLKMGVCVSSCPSVETFVSLYAAAPNGTSPNTMNAYFALFSSTEQFNRCVPDMSTFVCGALSGCTGAKATVKAGVDEVYDALTEGFQGLKEGWWVLLVCAVIAIIVCFLWMFVLRRLVKPMVVVTMIILVVTLAVGGYILFRMSKDDATSASASKYYLGGAIAAWIVDFLILCVILFVRRDVMVACDIIEEASKVPTSMPTMLLVPLVGTLFMLPFAFFFLFTSATIYTSASTISVDVLVPTTSGGSNTTAYVPFTAKQLQFENWRVYAEIYNLLMFLWTVGFLNAIAFITIAFGGIFWYWSNPGDDKKPVAGVCTAFGLAVKNHLGSLAIGSLIVAVIQVIRVVLSLLEKRLEAYAGKSDAVKCCLYCAECMLACFNRVVKFVNKNAYIMMAMTGEGFMDSAKHALDLLMQNALSVAAISVIGEWICLFGKVLITAVVLVICYFMSGGSNSDKNVVLLMIVVGLATYFITCVFINVFNVCIDTVLLSYCYDLREHDGQGKPYYFPSDLAKHVEKARERMKVAAEDRQKRDDMQKPLKQSS